MPTVEIVVENHYAPRRHASHDTPEESTSRHSLVSHLTVSRIHGSTLQRITSIQARDLEAMTSFHQRELELAVLHTPAKPGFRGSHLGLPRTPLSWI